jgi:myosin heavy subunit
MSDLSTAPDAGVVIDTATPLATATAPAETNPETGTDTEQEVKEVPAEKTFTQAELDEIVQRRIAKAESKAERRATQAYKEALEAITKPQQMQPSRAEPTRDQFASDAEWIDAKVEHKLQQRDNYQRESEGARNARAVQVKAQTIYAQAEKLTGFDKDAFDDLPVSQVMADVVMESDVAAQLMAFMSSHPSEVERIAKLTPVKQAVELGKLESKLQQPAKISKAPPPISPIGTQGGVSTSLANADFATYKAMRIKENAKWSR